MDAQLTVLARTYENTCIRLVRVCLDAFIQLPGSFLAILFFCTLSNKRKDFCVSDWIPLPQLKKQLSLKAWSALSL